MQSMGVIIFRYLAREVFMVLFSILMILLFIFVMHDSAHYLNRAIDSHMPLGTMIKLIALELPVLMGYLLPLSFFFALLLTLGRWSASHEILAWMSFGVSRLKLMRMALWLSVMVAILVASLTEFFIPAIQRLHVSILAETVKEQLSHITPRQFHTLTRPDRVLYANHSSDYQGLSSVFLAQSHPTPSGIWKWDVILARKAKVAHEHQHPFFLIEQGKRYEGQPGQGSFSVMNFDQYGIFLGLSLKRFQDRVSMKSMRDLWQLRLQDPKVAAEWHWRAAMPISVGLFAILAMALTQGVHRRLERYAALIVAIFIYFLYVDLIFAARSWIAHGQLSPSTGFWWIHAGLLGLALLILAWPACIRRWSR